MRKLFHQRFVYPREITTKEKENCRRQRQYYRRQRAKIIDCRLSISLIRSNSRSTHFSLRHDIRWHNFFLLLLSIWYAEFLNSRMNKKEENKSVIADFELCQPSSETSASHKKAKEKEMRFCTRHNHMRHFLSFQLWFCRCTRHHFFCILQNVIFNKNWISSLKYCLLQKRSVVSLLNLNNFVERRKKKTVHKLSSEKPLISVEIIVRKRLQFSNGQLCRLANWSPHQLTDFRKSSTGNSFEIDRRISPTFFYYNFTHEMSIWVTWTETIINHLFIEKKKWGKKNIDRKIHDVNWFEFEF